jgi:hypothetical protein
MHCTKIYTVIGGSPPVGLLASMFCSKSPTTISTPSGRPPFGGARKSKTATWEQPRSTKSHTKWRPRKPPPPKTRAEEIYLSKEGDEGWWANGRHFLILLLFAAFLLEEDEKRKWTLANNPRHRSADAHTCCVRYHFFTSQDGEKIRKQQQQEQQQQQENLVVEIEKVSDSGVLWLNYHVMTNLLACDWIVHIHEGVEQNHGGAKQ